jgi:hypothetical protein
MFSLFPHQITAISKLKTGSILCGGVGSGKSITSLAYFYTRVCGGSLSDIHINMTAPTTPRDLYIITTANKRDKLEWDSEAALFALSRDRDSSISGIQVTVDSWNNIKKYADVKGAFFIFDEQRVVGSGTWVKSFLETTKYNQWILLSATPADTWLDYIPAFVANGFYKNRTEFLRRHVVYNLFSPYPKVDHYVEVTLLDRHKISILVDMPYEKKTVSHTIDHIMVYDKDVFDTVTKKRWNPFEQKPVRDVAELCTLMRKISFSDPSRIEKIKDLLVVHPRQIVFYNYNFELDILRAFGDSLSIPWAEYNGHKHESVPEGDKWLYFVQYTSGAEGWNCVETNCVVFYSLHYSWRIMTQAAGRIDRLNTGYGNLYYHRLYSESEIDKAYLRVLAKKEKFNETKFVETAFGWGYTT